MYHGPRWRRALHRLGDKSPLDAYAAVHWPALDCRLDEVPLLALDFELDGLAKHAALLQVGWVECSPRSIALGSAISIDIRADHALNRDAVAVHGIGQARASGGHQEADVIAKTLEALAGKVVLAHGADIEVAALRGACRRLFGAAIPILSICTLRLARRLDRDRSPVDAYRLGAARRRAGLPEAGAHDAASDALATAELFLAQRRELDADVTLKDVATVSY